MRPTLYLGLAATVSLSSPTAQTQSQPATGGQTAQATIIEEVMVTARRRSENLQDIPVSVNAVSAEDLNKLNLLQFEDVEAAVPGLSLSSEGVLSRAALRGVTFQPETRTSATVEFYIDDALVESNYLFKSMFDIQQIEVLRGPQGTLRGRSSPSGAITVTTAKANTSQWEGYASTTLTNEEGSNVQGAINVPLIQNKLAIRLAGVFDDNRLNDVESANSAIDPKLETSSLRSSIRYEPIDSLDVSLTYQYLEEEQRFFHSVEGPGAAGSTTLPANFNGPVLTASNRKGITSQPHYIDQREELLVGRFSWRRDGHELSYVGSYSNKNVEDLTPLDRGNLLPDHEVFQDRPTHSPQRTHELRLSSTDPLWGKLDYTLGAFYSKNSINATFTVPANFLPGAFGPALGRPDPYTFDPKYQLSTTTSLREDSEETSFFANATWHLSDRTELSIGGRQIEYERSSVVNVSLGEAFAALAPGLLGFPSCEAGNFDSTYPGTCDIPSSVLGVQSGPIVTLEYPAEDESPFVYNLSIAHHFSEDLMAYASLGSAWRRGLDVSAEINNAGNNALLSELSVIKPEESETLEVGFKSSFWDNRGRLDVALFYQQFDGLILRTPSAPYLSDNGIAAATVVNRSFTANTNAVVQGMDVSLSLVMSPQWSLSAAYSLADGRIDDDDIPCRDSDFDGSPDLGEINAASFPAGTVIALCKSDAPISRAPKWNANLQSEYVFNLENNMQAYLRGLYNYYPDNKRESIGFTVDSYDLLNVYAGIRDTAGKWDLSVFAKNALDNGETLSRAFDQVQSTGSIETNFGPSGYYRTSYTKPRELGISARYHWH